MKIRIGFITNSSSSSFIIAAKKKIRFPEDENSPSNTRVINNLCDQVFSGDFCSQSNGSEFNEFNSLNELNNFEKEETYGVWWIKDNRDKIEKLFEQGYTIYELEFSHHDKVLATLLEEVIKLPDVVCVSQEDC
jgi:predicted GNAT superfamily acetyltransferase